MNPNNNQNLPYLQQLMETKSKINTLVMIIFLTIIFTIVGVLIYFFVIKDESLTPIVVTPAPTPSYLGLLDSHEVYPGTHSNNTQSSGTVNTPIHYDAPGAYTYPPYMATNSPGSHQYSEYDEGDYSPIITVVPFSTITPYTPSPTNISSTPSPTNYSFTPTPTNNPNLCSNGSSEFCFKNLVIEIDAQELSNIDGPNRLINLINSKLTRDLEINIGNDSYIFKKNDDYINFLGQMDDDNIVIKYLFWFNFNFNNLTPEQQTILSEPIEDTILSEPIEDTNLLGTDIFKFFDENGEEEINPIDHNLKIYFISDPDNYAELVPTS
jgi:hypothetical protein